MNPDDIPTEITNLADTCPYYLKPAIVPVVVAHFWPAIEAYIREQAAQEITDGLTAIHGDPATAQQFRPGLRRALRSIHRLARA